MKILVPAWSFYPSQEGGPSNALYWLASGLSKAGYLVRVVATSRCQKPGAVVENTWQRLNGFDVIYATVDRYDDYLKQELPQCDVLIANGMCRISNFRFNLKALSQGKHVILSPRGELLPSAVLSKGQVYGLLKALMFTVMKVCYGKKVLFHATSDEEVISIQKYMGKDVRIVEIPNYMILPEKIDFEQLTEPYLLYVGRLNQIKNIDIIISGLEQSTVFCKGHYKFKVAGEKKGVCYEALVSQVDKMGLSDKVDFLGLVTGEEKNQLYVGAKCLLLMSKSENFGNVIVEAMSQGTPVIASKGTPWHQLDEKGAGWWIEADPKQVGEAVDKLLTLDDDTYFAMRNAAYAYSREFDIYTNIGRWREVLGRP